LWQKQKNRAENRKKSFHHFFELFQVRFPSPPLTLFVILHKKKAGRSRPAFKVIFFWKNLETS